MIGPLLDLWNFIRRPLSGDHDDRSSAFLGGAADRCAHAEVGARQIREPSSSKQRTSPKMRISAYSIFRTASSIGFSAGRRSSNGNARGRYGAKEGHFEISVERGRQRWASSPLIALSIQVSDGR